MAKVLLINGSPRKQGNTFIALSEVAKTLNEQGIETEIEWVGTKPVRGCIACNTCKQAGNGKCVFDDDICNKIIEKINNSDALVVGAPVYYGVPPGQTLALIQRAFYAGAKVDNKPAAAITVCRRGGATAAFQTLQMPFQMVNMPLATSQYWNIVYGMMPGDASLDTEGLQTMRQLARNMAWMLKGMNPANPPEQEPWQGMHFIR
ncbi:MAG: flavodoxin family protein [Muribaculaceae bacterium]|nr:flavodoxin family protein [Muribaculaceae bacterium]MBQ5409800.1 flavodoxin family protein [Muribaculaceae bacterium]MDY6294449.1 flavodoxin family protein [Bacteroidales bacterium]